MSEGVRLETRVRDAVPNIEGEAYVVAAPPSAVVNSEAVVHVAKVA